MSNGHRGLGLAAAIVALPLLFGAMPSPDASADSGGQDVRATQSRTGPAKSKGTGRGAPRSSRTTDTDVDYPSYLPELTPTQKGQLNAELAKVPPNLRGTMTVYIVHKLWPEYFSPGVLLAPNPMA